MEVNHTPSPLDNRKLATMATANKKQHSYLSYSLRLYLYLSLSLPYVCVLSSKMMVTPRSFRLIPILLGLILVSIVWTGFPNLAEGWRGCPAAAVGKAPEQLSAIPDHGKQVAQRNSGSAVNALENGPQFEIPEVVKQPAYRTFIAVFTAPSEYEHRMVWRSGLFSKTYLNEYHRKNPDDTVITRFILGHDDTLDPTIMKEQERYGDIVMLDMYDGYFNLTQKTGLLMEWSTYSADFSFQYLLRMDVDTFVLLENFHRFVKTLPERSIAGYIRQRTPVLREHHKWTDSKYPVDQYLPYPGGPSYVLTDYVVRYLGCEHRANMLQYYANEDASVGVWVAGRTVALIHNPLMLHPDCDSSMITKTHGVTYEEHGSMVHNLLKCQNPCGCSQK